MRVPWGVDLLARCTVLGTLMATASSAPLPVETPFNSSLDAHVLSRRGELDLSYKNFAAVGDSYASGLGAGRVLDRTCRRYDHSYANLINTDTTLGDQEHDRRRFEFVACAGAKIPDIVYRQMPQLTTEFDVITITAGGNDVGFGKIVDTCIFGVGRQTCESRLSGGREYIANILPQALDKLLWTAGTKLTPTGHIYITGYAKFFNAESLQCNAVSVSILGRKKPLDQYHRESYNELIDHVNKEIGLAAERAGSYVTFVNYDPYFSKCGGRLCEFGVIEPRPNRPNLMFFERGSTDVRIDELSDGNRFLGRRFNWGSVFSLPDTDLRVFHPRSNGQRLIADVVLAHMREDRAKSLGLESAPRKDNMCPVPK